MKNGFKIVDFRCRPPVPAYKVLFDLHLQRQSRETKFVCAPENAVTPSMLKVGDPAGLDLLLAEIDEAGIDLVVAPGRKMSVKIEAIGEGTSEINVTDEALAGLRRRFNDRLLGLSGLDLSQPADQTASQIEKSVKDYDMRGVVIEPGYYTEPDGGPLHADNPRLYPIYEAVIALDLFVMHQSGIYAGPDISANYWPPLDRLLQNFPRLKFVLAHGGYPAVIDALSLAVKHENFHISPDVYSFAPAGELYVNAISKLPDQFIFGSAYPLACQKASVEGALRFPLSDDVMAKYLYGNAARLVKLTPAARVSRKEAGKDKERAA